MLLLRMWNYTRGYVIILVEGDFLEKFINICIKRQIYLWDIKRQGKNKMSLKISINGFKLIRSIAWKTTSRVRIIKKCGIPFVVNRYRKRKTFLFGALLFIVVFYMLTSYIWAVEIKGIKKLESQVIIDELAQIGIKPGVLKYKINTEKAVNNLTLNIKEIAWISVEVKGTKVKVEVVERVIPPKIVPINIPCNIKAQRDGVIKTVIAKSGQHIVKEGDTVVKDQVLISGIIESQIEDAVPRQVHAIGEVRARTWYENKCPVNVNVLENKRTGKKSDNFSFVLFAKRIELFPHKVSYKKFESEQVNKKVSIGKDIVIPFEIVIDKFYETKTINRKINLDDAKDTAVAKAYSNIISELPLDVDVKNKEVEFIIDENGMLFADVILECEEDIGYTEEIGGT